MRTVDRIRDVTENGDALVNEAREQLGELTDTARVVAICMVTITCLVALTALVVMVKHAE